jgi:transposase
MSTTRRIFPEAFKREAVDRAASGGLSVEKVATELGLHETVLRRWVKQFSAQATGSEAPHHASAGPVAV